ncbi:MAG TPA: vWA domain-containing protein [Gaiellaceae bacterium]|nr:vWA domain-containing protein [Gaiellaceae bacterium]
MIPLAAFALMERRTGRVRRFFSLAAPRRRDLAVVAVALAVLPALVAVAAAQPVVVHRQWVTERLDAEAFVVFDTSQSMTAQAGPNAPTRLERAKQEALQLIPQLSQIPVGIATMTDRVLPDLMPTADLALVRRVIAGSVGINQPPPIERYSGRATTLHALFPVSNDNLFAPETKRRILVIFTDGEASPLPHALGYDIAQQLTIPPLFVHVWAPNERIYVHGRVDPRYRPDPASLSVLRQFATDTRGEVFGEHDLAGLVRAIRAEAGTKPARAKTLGYERSALGPWFLLAGVVPLGFLLFRRNL